MTYNVFGGTLNPAQSNSIKSDDQSFITFLMEWVFAGINAGCTMMLDLVTCSLHVCVCMCVRACVCLCVCVCLHVCGNSTGCILTSGSAARLKVRYWICICCCCSLLVIDQNCNRFHVSLIVILHDLMKTQYKTAELKLVVMLTVFVGLHLCVSLSERIVIPHRRV